MNRQTTRWLRASLTAAALTSLFTTTANAQDQLWLRQFGTSGDDAAMAVASDGRGGVIVAGGTTGNLGGPNSGEWDAFLARYDSSGSRLWIRQFGTSESDGAGAIAPGPADGVFVAGRTWGSFGGPNAGRSDIFLAFHDRDGNQLWIRQFGTEQDDYVSALAPDGADGVYVGGTLDFPSSMPSVGGEDAFLARYDMAGNQLWITRFGTNKSDYALALAHDGAGGVFVSGLTQGSLGGPNAGDWDAFLARYDNSGSRLWIRQFGTSEGEGAEALASDGAGGVLVAGTTDDDLGGPNAGSGDAFVARYDGAGSRLWIRQFGTTRNDHVYAAAPDGRGGVIVAGETNGSLGGPFAGWYDVFLARYNGAGDQLWVGQFGTENWEFVRGVGSDGAGGVFVAGAIWGRAANYHDAYVARVVDNGCYHADCDQSTGVGVLDMLDFLCFQTAFMNGEEFACDCDTTTGTAVCDIFDFLCFQNAFVAGCQ